MCDRRGIEAATEDEYWFRHGWMVGDIDYTLLGLTDETNLGELTMSVATTVVAIARLLGTDPGCARCTAASLVDTGHAGRESTSHLGGSIGLSIDGRHINP